MTSSFPSFFEQLGGAWRLFIQRWGIAVVLQLLMIIPALLMIPLALTYMSAVNLGEDVVTTIANSPYTVEFLMGFFGTIFFGILATTAMMIAFASKKKITLMVALTSAAKRYIPVLYTSFLAGLAVAVAFIPAQLLNYWYSAVGASLPVSGGGRTAVDVVVFVAVVALMIPAVIVSVWVMYAPLAVALKETPSGLTAILFSKAMVHKHIWSIVWRMVGVLIFFEAVSISVSALPIAGAVVPLILVMLTVAFFVELYKELRVR